MLLPLKSPQKGDEIQNEALFTEKREKGTSYLRCHFFLLVPSPLVEKRSDPYHGSVLPLNYEGGMPRGYNQSGKGDYRQGLPLLQPIFSFARVRVNQQACREGHRRRRFRCAPSRYPLLREAHRNGNRCSHRCHPARSNSSVTSIRLYGFPSR